MTASDIHALSFFADGISSLAEPVCLEDFGSTSEEAAESLRHADGLSAPVYVCGLCTSSLDMAHHFIREGQLPVWGSVLVSAQSAGRGQLGRNWHSPPGNLFAALRLPDSAPFNGTAAAPALGAYVAAALSELGYPIRFKWPNDLVAAIGGCYRKICGMLIEERQGCLVAGIGINIVSAPPSAAMREGHALPGGCLADLIEQADRADHTPNALSLWLRLVSGIKFCYEQIPLSDSPGMPAPQQLHWRQLAETRLLYKGCRVGIVDGPDAAVHLRGIVTGLSLDGALRLQDGSVAHTVYSGSLVPE